MKILSIAEITAILSTLVAFIVSGYPVFLALFVVFLCIEAVLILWRMEQ